MTTWQPIETAPKDGTWIILAYKCGEDAYRVNEGRFTGRCPYWRIRSSSYHPDFVTHWMPLPEPPTS